MSVWLSFWHFPFSFCLLVAHCLSLPPFPSVSTCLSFSFFLLLSFACCLTLTLSLFHSALSSSPSLSYVCVSLSAFLLPSCPPPLLLISPSLSLYLTFSPFFLFFLSLLPFTRLLHALSSHSLTLFPASLPPSLHLCLCFCSHSALQCFCLISCFSILFSFLNLAQFSFFSFFFFSHLNVCLCGDQ